MIPACLAILLLATVLVYVLRDHSRERTDWAKERNLLISRIQSPEYAPALAAQAIPPTVDDDGYSEEREMRNLIYGAPVDLVDEAPE